MPVLLGLLKHYDMAQIERAEFCEPEAIRKRLVVYSRKLQIFVSML
jgi:hypothetical protein